MSTIYSNEVQSNKETTWPANELENILNCPVCGALEREILHKGLFDNVFYTAPGKWNSWRCLECRCSYLDPQPSRASIHMAYRNYYTHHEPISNPSYNSLSLRRKLRRKLANGYINWRYSAKNIPALGVGIPLLLCLWPLKNSIDRTYRHMPRIPAGGGLLLDVGCGNCSFLELAKSSGWHVVGIDPDEEAIEHGLNKGLNVKQGGIEQFEDEESLFDVITINHVIEHVHDPVALLKACNRLLKTSGQLWLETPNIDSFGHHHYMENWRGLEPPRHLVIFNLSSLTKALVDTGFTRVKSKSGLNAQFFMTMASEAIKQGLPDGAAVNLNWKNYFMIIKNRFLEYIYPSRKEILTMVACKGV
jgi:2-polyprenyl-3-methyl-5-hydroxy-6-metoxy-1,4-benzoquinol methylase